jgi:hypothetical protein
MTDEYARRPAVRSVIVQSATLAAGRATVRTGRRRVAVVLAAAVLGLYALVGCFFAVNIHHRLDPSGAPLFYDYSAFRQAATFADSGRAALAYDDRAMIAAEQASFPGTTARLPWHYPPTFQLLLMPFGALPYVTAWLLWSGALYGLYALLAWRLVGAGQRWIVLLAPGAAINLLVGQNGLLSTVLMGGGVLMLRQRPIVGGVLLGLMSYKPHFAVLIPLALISGRAWRALGAAAAAAAGSALLSVAVLGVQPWIGFLRQLAQPSAVFSSSSSAWRTIPSVMIMARSLGLDGRLSAALHWSVAAMAAIGALWVWRKTDDVGLRAAALATATLIVTPYLRLYDLALLILPIAVLLPGAEAEGGIGQRAILFAAWLLPAVLLLAQPSIQVGAVIPVALMGLVLWRAGRNGDLARGAAPTRLAPLAPWPY